MLSDSNFLNLLKVNNIRIPKTKLGRKIFEHRWAEVYKEYCDYRHELEEAKPTVERIQKEIREIFPGVDLASRDLFNIATENPYFPDKSPKCIKVVLHYRKKGVKKKHQDLLENKLFNPIISKTKSS